MAKTADAANADENLEKKIVARDAASAGTKPDFVHHSRVRPRAHTVGDRIFD